MPLKSTRIYKKMKQSPEDICKAVWLGGKTRMILKSHKIDSLRQQVVDMQDFYQNVVNNHVKTARLNYVTGVHDFLKLPSWFKEI